MSPSKKPSLVGAYDLRLVTAEIEAVRRQRVKLTVKQAADILGIDRKLWYKKRDINGSSFSFSDMSILAEAWRAPRGWPFLTWSEAEDFETWRRTPRR